MTDYSWPSVYFAYLTFAILVGLAAYFLYRTWNDGYWGEHGEDVKYRMLEDD